MDARIVAVPDWRRDGLANAQPNRFMLRPAHADSKLSQMIESFRIRRRAILLLFAILFPAGEGCFSDYRYYQRIQVSSVDPPGSVEGISARITLPEATLWVTAHPSDPVHTFLHSRGLAFAPFPIATFGDASDATFEIDLSVVPRRPGLSMDFRRVTFENGASPVSVRNLATGKVLPTQGLSAVAVEGASSFSMAFRCFSGGKIVTLSIGGLLADGKAVQVPAIRSERKSAYTYVPWKAVKRMPFNGVLDAHRALTERGSVSAAGTSFWRKLPKRSAYVA